VQLIYPFFGLIAQLAGDAVILCASLLFIPIKSGVQMIALSSELT
jgi:hypothetical protein